MTYLSAHAVLILVLFVSISHAHVRIDSPKEGDILTPLSEINIEWTETQDHGVNDWDLYYSLDGGTVWKEIILDVEESVRVYTWKVPITETSLARIKIIQDNSSTDYEDITGEFTISNTLPDDDDNNELITALDDISDHTKNEIQLFNYPNPFHSQTTFQFSIAKKSHVELNVYNMLGKIVFTGADDVYDIGTHEIIMKNQGLPNGIYLSVLTLHGQKITRKMILKP